ncbi:MAG TPA: SAM-dependent methyltransferase [Steroidobacteraceae bacterium]|nr:SAM-dependent methyltransferase [Steroidobacteraceae bacterium]
MRRNDTATAALRELLLNDTQAEHCARMREYLTELIAAAAGWLPFERFMDAALYAPGLGYYSAGARKFGAGGDFITAPEVSPLFGACLARQCAEILDKLGEGSILEIGAGSGRLAADILLRLETLGVLPARYWILEISADLRERQRRHLAQRAPHLAERLHWLDGPPEGSFDGLILANEVLDALPVTRFRWYRDRVEELGVVIDDGRFAWAPRPASQAVAQVCRRLAQAGGAWDDGYVSEYCPRLNEWTRSVTGSLRTGAALWFDYGLPRSQYYLPERHEGTLLCHFQHRAHGDPFLYPGLQDMTAWVDYTLLAEASRAAGFALAGFTTQSFFLAGLGVDEEMHAMAGDDAVQFARLANQARQLMLPGEMGERFKAMAWMRGLTLPLSGFALQDLRHTL